MRHGLTTGEEQAQRHLLDRLAALGIPAMPGRRGRVEVNTPALTKLLDRALVHTPRYSGSNGQVTLTCSCGECLGRFRADDDRAVSMAWIEHNRPRPEHEVAALLLR